MTRRRAGPASARTRSGPHCIARPPGVPELGDRVLRLISRSFCSLCYEYLASGGLAPEGPVQTIECMTCATSLGMF